MQSQDTAWAEDDDAATVADMLAPHFTITNDAQPFATVHSHRLPVPEVGETYIVLGRLTLEQAFDARNIHIPDWLQDLDAQVQGLLELDDTREHCKGVAGRLHAVVRVTRVPGKRLRLQIRDCTRGTEDGEVHRLALGVRTRIIRRMDGRLITVSDEGWSEIQHGDQLLLCPQHKKEDYIVFKFDVSIPLAQLTAEEEATARLAQPHMLKFVLPGRDLGQLIGKGGRIKTALEREHRCVIEIASSQHVYPGEASALIHGRAVGITVASATGIIPALHAVLTATDIPVEGFYLVVPASVASTLQSNDGMGLRRLQERLKHEVGLQILPPAAAAPPPAEQILACSGSIDGIVEVVGHVMKMLSPKSVCGYMPIEPENVRARVRGAGGGYAGVPAGSSSGPRPAAGIGGGAGHRGRAGAGSRDEGDETLMCRDCNGTFVFSVSEQAFYQEKNFNTKPGRCLKCRKAKRTEGKRQKREGGKHTKTARVQATRRGDNTTRNKVLKKAHAAVRKIRKDAAQDQASRRGDNTTRNKVRKKANAAKRTAQKNLRGNRGHGRK